MVSRTVGGISLGPTGNIQGTYKFLSLLTGNVIQARSFTILPMPTEIIKMVESMSPGYQPTTDDFENYADDESEFGGEEPGHDIGSEIFNVGDLEGVGFHRNEEMMNESEYGSIDEEENGSEQGEDEVDVEGVGDETGGIEEIGININENAEAEAHDQENNTEDDGRTHHVTRSGRRVKYSEDLYNNYSLLQKLNKPKMEEGSVSYPDEQTPTVRQVFGVVGDENVGRLKSPGNDGILHYAFTQYSLKQGLNKFPEKAKEAMIAEIRQLHEMDVFALSCSKSLYKL